MTNHLAANKAFHGTVLLAIVLAAIGTLLLVYGAKLDKPLDVKAGTLTNLLFPPNHPNTQHMSKAIGVGLWAVAGYLLWRAASGA